MHNLKYQNVLSPEGRCESISCRGPIVFTYVLFVVQEGVLEGRYSMHNLKYQNVLFDGVGRTEAKSVL